MGFISIESIVSTICRIRIEFLRDGRGGDSRGFRTRGSGRRDRSTRGKTI